MRQIAPGEASPSLQQLTIYLYTAAAAVHGVWAGARESTPRRSSDNSGDTYVDRGGTEIQIDRKTSIHAYDIPNDVSYYHHSGPARLIT